MKSLVKATDHIELYEKYGFSYIESRMDVYNEMSRIYCRKLYGLEG